MKDFDQKRVRELLDYDPDTGELRWRSRPRDEFPSLREWAAWNGKCAGKVAGSTSGRGYRAVKCDGILSYAHRVIWVHVYGEIPDTIDHINGIRDDNRLANLRSVSHRDNMRNQPRHKTNTSGVTGVVRCGNKWTARIRTYDHNHYLGIFEDKNDAIAARKAAEVKYGFHPNHGRAAA